MATRSSILTTGSLSQHQAMTSFSGIPGKSTPVELNSCTLKGLSSSCILVQCVSLLPASLDDEFCSALQECE